MLANLCYMDPRELVGRGVGARTAVALITAVSTVAIANEEAVTLYLAAHHHAAVQHKENLVTLLRDTSHLRVALGLSQHVRLWELLPQLRVARLVPELAVNHHTPGRHLC